MRLRNAFMSAVPQRGPAFGAPTAPITNQSDGRSLFE